MDTEHGQGMGQPGGMPQSQQPGSYQPGQFQPNPYMAQPQTPYYAPGAPQQNAPQQPPQGMAQPQTPYYAPGAPQQSPYAASWQGAPQQGPQTPGTPMAPGPYGATPQGPSPYGPGYGDASLRGYGKTVAKEKKTWPVAVITVAVVLLLILVPILCMLIKDAYYDKELDDYEAEHPSVRYDTCEGYATFLARLSEVNDKSSTLKALTSDEYDSWVGGKVSDDTKAGRITDWTDQIAQQYDGFMRLGDTRSTSADCSTANSEYERTLNGLNETARLFQLGKTPGSFADWAISGTDMHTDGSGAAYYRPVYLVSWQRADGMPDAADIPGLEQKVASYTASAADADGTYLQAGDELLSTVGLNRVNVEDVPENAVCRSDDSNAFAYYCEDGEPHTVVLNTQYAHYADVIRDEALYLDTLRHEIAHYLVYARCDSGAPPVGANAEALANSYALSYLGASKDELEFGKDGYGEYVMTEASDKGAQMVHEGTCIANPL